MKRLADQVPLTEKIDMLLAVSTQCRKVRGIHSVLGEMGLVPNRQLFRNVRVELD